MKINNTSKRISKLLDSYLSSNLYTPEQEVELIIDSFENLNECDIENIEFPSNSDSFEVINVIPQAGKGCKTITQTVVKL